MCEDVRVLLAKTRLHAQSSTTANDTKRREQLSCFELPSPLAVLRLSAASVDLRTESGGLVIRIGPRDRLGSAPQVALFGAAVGGGGPFDSTGSARIDHRDPGVHQLVVRADVKQEHVRARKREHIHFETSRSCAVNTRFQQYLDIMLADLGQSHYRKLPNVVAEIFAPYKPADHAGIVETHLATKRDKSLAVVSLPT